MGERGFDLSAKALGDRVFLKFPGEALALFGSDPMQAPDEGIEPASLTYFENPLHQGNDLLLAAGSEAFVLEQGRQRGSGDEMDWIDRVDQLLEDPLELLRGHLA